MIRRFLETDRQTALAIGVLVVAFLLFSAGAVGIYATLRGNDVDLPSEGTISEIVESSDETPDYSGALETPEAESAGPPPPPPARMVIPSLYIDAPVVAKGVMAGAVPEVPDRPDQVAWYPPVPEYPSFSSYPGRASNSVFAGHVDWQTRDGAPIPGVFYRLREMKIGQPIDIILEDGTRLQYRVTGNVATKYDDPEVSRVMQRTAREVITLITCGGSWISSSRFDAGGNYTHRIIVRAERVGAPANAASAGGGR